jgi:hypothetical protein
MVIDSRTFRPGSECGQLSIGFALTAVVLWVTVIFFLPAILFGAVGLVFGLIGLRRTRGGLRKDVRNAWLGTTLSVLSFATLPVMIFVSNLY